MGDVRDYPLQRRDFNFCLGFCSFDNIGVKPLIFRRGSEVSPGMALVVGIAQPFMQPQVNALQSFCFVCASSEVVQGNAEAARLMFKSANNLLTNCDDLQSILPCLLL